MSDVGISDSTGWNNSGEGYLYPVKKLVRVSRVTFQLKDASSAWCHIWHGQKKLLYEHFSGYGTCGSLTIGPETSGIPDFYLDLKDGSDLRVEIKYRTCAGGREVCRVKFALEETGGRVREHKAKDLTLSLDCRLVDRTVLFHWKNNQSVPGNDYGVFCRVVEINGLYTVPVRFTREEYYGLLEASLLLHDLIDGTWYAAVYLSGCTPLVEAWQVDHCLWLIPMKGCMVKNIVLRVPFRRRSPELDRGEERFGVQSIFSAVPGLFCKQIPEGLFEMTGTVMGCVEFGSPSRIDRGDWVAAPARLGPWALVGSEPTCDFGTGRIQLFRLGRLVNEFTKIRIVRRRHVISNEMAFIVLPREVTEPLYGVPISVLVEASEATEVQVYCRARGTTVALGPEGRHVFTGKIDCNGSSQLLAITQFQATPFRFFKVEVDSLTLFDYNGTNEGMIQFGGDDDKLQPGFRRQVIRKLTNGLVYKTWSGIPILTPLNVIGTIVVICNWIERGISGQKWGSLAFWLKIQNKPAIPVPMSIKKYVENPLEFFAPLGLKESGYKPTGDVVTFTENGTLIFDPDAILVRKLKANRKILLSLLDFAETEVGEWRLLGTAFDDESDVEENAPVAELSDGMDDDTLLMLEVAVGAFVGVLIISLIGLLIYRRRSKAKGKNSSTLSDPSSSDDVRQEGLTEAIE